jgi:hypothetical protein
MDKIDDDAYVLQLNRVHKNKYKRDEAGIKLDLVQNRHHSIITVGNEHFCYRLVSQMLNELSDLVVRS